MKKRSTRILLTKTILAAAFLGCWLPLHLGAQDGRIVETSIVTFTNDQLREFAARSSTIRRVLSGVEISTVTYLSDGLKVNGYLLRPKEEGVYPCVIYNRGGNREFGVLSQDNAVFSLARIASWGYVVVASQYRGNAGGEGQEEFGGADVNDVVSLIPLLESIPQADATRIGMYGQSRGGMMTYLALTRTDRIRAAAIRAGMADSFDTVARRPEMVELVYSQLVPGWRDQREEALEARSAVRWPEKLHKGTPILLLHGSSDWRVHPSQAFNMAEALYESKHLAGPGQRLGG